MLGNFRWKIRCKNLEILCPPFDLEVPRDQRGRVIYMIVRFLHRTFHKTFLRTRPIAFQWPAVCVFQVSLRLSIMLRRFSVCFSNCFLGVPQVMLFSLFFLGFTCFCSLSFPLAFHEIKGVDVFLGRPFLCPICFKHVLKPCPPAPSICLFCLVCLSPMDVPSCLPFACMPNMYRTPYSINRRTHKDLCETCLCHRKYDYSVDVCSHSCPLLLLLKNLTKIFPSTSKTSKILKEIPPQHTHTNIAPPKKNKVRKVKKSKYSLVFRFIGW